MTVAYHYPHFVMTTIARMLDKKLKEWPTATSRKVERLVTEAIVRGDATAKNGGTHGRRIRSRKPDSLFGDTATWRGKAPRDSSVNHDKFLYGEAE